MSKEQVERALTCLFVGLQFFGLCATTLTLFAARFSPVPRQATWHNFIFSWGIFSFSYLLLVIGGKLDDTDPPLGLCLAQSALTYAAPPFVAATSLSLVLSLYMTVRARAAHKGMPASDSPSSLLLLVVPYLVFVGVLLEALAVALSDPRKKFDHVPFCSLINPVPGRVTSALVVILVIPMIVLNVVIYSYIKKRSDALQTSRASKSLFIRVTLFTLCGVLGVVMGVMCFFIVFVKDRALGNMLLNLILALGPTTSILIFATHKDLLMVWITLLRRLLSRGRRLPAQDLEIKVSVSQTPPPGA